ncbi:MAG: hypothetical protein KAI90_04160 [Desulfobulbaceae bacterium]|nr:hypothetical protein [Desulfobulbaceae bacterium]
MGNNPPFRAAPVRVLVPPTAESSTTVCRRFLRTGDRSSMPRTLPQPNNGEVHIFFSREGLVSHFNSIPADQRGNLYNEDPDAFRGQVRSSGEEGPLPPLAAIPRGIGNIPVSRPHYIYLVEQYGWGTTVMTGIGTARRATTSTPPTAPLRKGMWQQPAPTHTPGAMLWGWPWITWPASARHSRKECIILLSSISLRQPWAALGMFYARILIMW